MPPPESAGAIAQWTQRSYALQSTLFNNAKKRQDKGELFIQGLNAILRKNRTLLRQANPEGKTTLRREVLQQAGFDFRYYTHQYQTKQGNTYNFCYDYGYLLLPDNKMLIVNWQPYMDK